MVNEWTRDDLPRIGTPDPAQDSVVEGVLDAVLHWLNKHHPKPHGSVAVMLEDIHRVQLDRDRWRRAHEIVEGERDQARRERDKWEEKYLDTDEALHRTRREREEAVARAEAAEARTAPAVSRADVERVVGAVYDAEEAQFGQHAWPGRVPITAAVWGLLTEDELDPAVHVVRESDIAAVSVKQGPHGAWTADGEFVAVDDAEQAGHLAREYLTKAVRRFAVQRAIEAEQATDPVEELAGQIETATREAIRQVCVDLAAVAPSIDPLAVEQAMGVTAASRKVAAHILGQEAKR